MPADPSIQYGPTIYPIPGWLKAARIFGIDVLVESASLGNQPSPKYTTYAITLPTGPRQKTLHSRGTKESSWSLTGDISVESFALINFLSPGIRGVYFNVEVLQGAVSDVLTLALMENCSFSGSANGNIKFSLSGKSLTEIATGPAWSYTNHKYTVPGWASGNELISTWTLTHNISLQANWANDQSPLPAYYRPGQSEYTLQFTTVHEYREYDAISIGIGTVAMITGFVTNRTISYSGKGPKTYDVSVTNVNTTMNTLTPGLLTLSSATIPEDWLNS